MHPTGYFINNLVNGSFHKNGIFVNGINIHLLNESNTEIKSSIFYTTNKGNKKEIDWITPMISDERKIQKILNNNFEEKYFGLYERNNIFFIHPNETIYFKLAVNLNHPTDIDRKRIGFIKLESGKKYFSNITLESDSTNYKNVLPGDLLKTIEANNVKVYHGTLKSKNIIPVKVIN